MLFYGLILFPMLVSSQYLPGHHFRSGYPYPYPNPGQPSHPLPQLGYNSPYGPSVPSQYLPYQPSALQPVLTPQLPKPCDNTKPKIDYGDCPQLKETEEEKMEMEEKQNECINDLGGKPNTTKDELSENLQKRVDECVLRKTMMVNDVGKYDFEKAQTKLKEKNLPEHISKKLLEDHFECKKLADAKFLETQDVLSQVAQYQGCLDFHTSIACGVKAKYPNQESPSFTPGIPPYPGMHFHDRMIVLARAH